MTWTQRERAALDRGLRRGAALELHRRGLITRRELEKLLGRLEK